MKRKISNVLFGLLFLVGFGILAYPTISDRWNAYRQSKLISDYEEAVAQMAEEDFEETWAAARAYNSAFTKNNITADVFGVDGTADMRETEYWGILNVTGDGIMGYLSIPKIDVNLSVYHGTSDEVLQTGVGHMNGSKLPIGGESNHSVLAAHRGLPSAKLFTDIDRLEEGDRFYLHILNADLAYEVDRILPMIDKDDYAALEEAVQIEEGADQVTLFTCTPYGVNSHRLLVRGHRVPYDGEETGTPEAAAQENRRYYLLFFLAGLLAAGAGIFAVRRSIKRKRQREQNSETSAAAQSEDAPQTDHGEQNPAGQ